MIDYGQGLNPYQGLRYQPASVPGMLWNPDISTVSHYTNNSGSKLQVDSLVFADLADGEKASLTVVINDITGATANFSFTSVGATTGDKVLTAILKQFRQAFRIQATVKAEVSAANTLKLTSRAKFSTPVLTKITKTSLFSIIQSDVIPYAVPVFSAGASATNKRGVQVVNRDLLPTDSVKGITVRHFLNSLKLDASLNWVDGYDSKQPVSVASGGGKISILAGEDIGATPDLYFCYAGDLKNSFSGTAGTNKTKLPVSKFSVYEFIEAGKVGYINLAS